MLLFLNPVLAQLTPLRRHALLRSGAVGPGSPLLCPRRHLQVQWLLLGRIRPLGVAHTPFPFWKNGSRFSSLCSLLITHICPFQPTTRALLESILLTSIIIAPFVVYHLYTFTLFCLDTSATTPEWCDRAFPSIYSYVQAKYWNIGFLRYWTPSQLPNFLIAAPTILLICAFSFHHLKETRVFTVTADSTEHPFENPSITPHVIHALILTSILVFASHTQIILRLAASMPLVYWAAAWLFLEHPSWARLWVTWSVLWSMISTILWAAFLPPA
ncbi:hypothetical protein CPB84DRAFT_1782666 [Gymnopilus junonius]|uniref:GPI mannosyltransferase 2 n=1 Tax=Gymnopilus junonius TaxID=109634 RepID=A0A9P5TKW6_GYMJU|nr:hypothetical protein CPB84DRAFT_1782666 [Gymnopilus junonius]